MDLIVILLVGILGIAAGVAIGIVAGRRKSVEAQTRCKILEARLTDKEADFTNRMAEKDESCLLYTSPSPRDRERSRMPSSA